MTKSNYRVGINLVVYNKHGECIESCNIHKTTQDEFSPGELAESLANTGITDIALSLFVRDDVIGLTPGKSVVIAQSQKKAS